MELYWLRRKKSLDYSRGQRNFFDVYRMLANIGISCSGDPETIFNCVYYEFKNKVGAENWQLFWYR